MADNWKNNILPGSQDLNVDSTEFTDDDSLVDIANKYQNLGTQFNKLGYNAAEDVHQRQVKLIGNDFGPVNPTMRAAYYQPAINDNQSAMRMAGTEAALGEGMKRGKAAAEADLEAAKKSYNDALDGYKSAKEAFSNLVVSGFPSDALPDGVTETEAEAIYGFTQDRDAARKAWLHNYTDSWNVDWSDEQKWSDAVNKTISDLGVNTEGWGEEDWNNFWADSKTSYTFENNYVSQYIKDHFKPETYDQYVTSYNQLVGAIDQVFDWVNDLSDTLPVASFQILSRDGASELAKKVGTDDNLANTLLRDTAANKVADYRKDSWIEENIADAYKEDVKKFAKEQQDTFNKMWKETGNTPQNHGYLNSVHESMAKEYLNYIADKLKDFSQETEVTPTVGMTTTTTNQWLEKVFGFSESDVWWMKKWKEQNPDEYESMKYQIAMAHAQTDAIEVADGTRWYYTGKGDNGGYEKLPAGTPVFFAYEGALNEDGSIRDDSALADFVDKWKNFYKADAQGVSEEELTSAADALNAAYKEYMNEVSGAITVNTVFKTKVTPEIYSAIIACFNNPGKSNTKMYDDQTVGEFIQEFKAAIAKDKDAAVRWFYSIANKAYSNTDTIMRYSNTLGAIVMDDKKYDASSEAGYKNKLEWHEGSYSNPEINGTVEDAVAAYLVLTRSMEKFNDGSTADNIDPSFLSEDFIGKVYKSVGRQAMGMVDFWAAVGNLISGCGRFFIDGTPPAENGGGMSFNNIIGSIFTGERHYDKDSPWQQGEIRMQLDDLAHEYALSLVNPLLIDVYYGNKDISQVKGIGSQYTVQGKGMFEDWASAQNTLIELGAMVATNVAEGKIIGSGVNLVGRGALRLEAKLLPYINEYHAINKGLDTVGRGLNWLDNIDDPYLAAQTARNTLQLTSALDDASGAANTVEALNLASHLDDVPSASNALATAGSTINVMDDLPAVEQSFGILNRRAAYALSSTATNSLDDMVSMYGAFAKKAAKTLDDIADSYTGVTSASRMTEKVVLASGQTVSIAEASAVVAANRIFGVSTLSMATGIDPMRLAALPDGARNMLLKTLNGITSNKATGVIADKGINAFLKSLSADDFNNLVEAFVDRASINAMLGKKWDAFDTYRALGKAGWEKSGSRALAREFLADALTDPLRDLRRNAMNPRFDENGNPHVETVAEYFTTPENLLLNLGMSSVHFGIQRAWNQFGSWHWSKESTKAWDAFNNTGDKTSEAAAKALQRAEFTTLKAQEFADKAWKKGMSYEKVLKNAQMSNDTADKALRGLFESQGWDLDYGGKQLKFKTADEFFKFMNDKAAPTKDLLMSLQNTVLVKAANIYNLSRVQMGVDINEFGRLAKSSYVKIWDTMRKTVNTRKSEFTGNKKPIMENVHGMYQAMKADLIAANNAGEFGMKIRNFEKSLDSFFGNLETIAKDGIDSGFLPNVRVGYLPIGSLYFDGSFDDMVKSHINGATRGFSSEGGTLMDKTAPDPSSARDVISLDSLIDGFMRGDKTLDITDANGKVIRTVQLDYDGLNPIDATTYYMNNYTMHKYIDPLMGDEFKDYGGASMQNGRAFYVGDEQFMLDQWTKEFKTASDAIFGYDGTTKAGKNFHHEGFAEKIARLGQEQGVITETQAADIKEKGFSTHVYTDEQQAQIDRLNTAYAEVKKNLDNAKAVIDAGDSPNGYYATIASVFGRESANGIGNTVDGKWYVDTGTKIARKLLNAYTRGEISENTMDQGYTIEVSVGKKGAAKKAYKDIPVTNNLLTMLDNAVKNNGQINSDLIAYAAIYNDISTPYWSKKVENGVTTTVPVEGYKSLLMEKYNVSAQKLELDETPTASTLKAVERTISDTYEVSTAGDTRFSALNARFKENGSRVLYGQNLSGLTIEEAYQKLKGAGKGKAPAEDSQIGIITRNAETRAGRKLTKAEKEQISLEAYTGLWREWAKENPELINELRQKASGRPLSDKFAKTKVSQAAALETILNETDPLRKPDFTNGYSKQIYQSPEELRKVIDESVGYDNLDSSTKKQFEEYKKLVEDRTKKIEASDEYKKLLEKDEEAALANYQAKADSDAAYAAKGIYSDDEDISGEWDDEYEYSRSYMDEHLYNKQLLKARDNLIAKINEDLTVKRDARTKDFASRLTAEVKGYDKYGMVDVNKTNKFVADAIFKNNGNVVFGATKVVDELTGKVTYEGGKEFQADKLYGSRYALTRSETDDIVVKTSESKFADLQEATELQLYSALGAAKAEDGSFAPTEYQKRVVESVVNRTKTEMADTYKAGETFNGNEWFNAIDTKMADVELASKFGENWKNSKGQTRNASAIIKGLETDGSLEYFKNNLDSVAARARLGDFDDLLPDGMTREDLAQIAMSAKQLLDGADDFKYRPKKADEATPVLDEDENELEYYAESTTTDLEGNTIEGLDFGSRFTGPDLDKTVVSGQLDNLIRILKAVDDPRNRMHKVFVSDDMARLRNGRIEAKNTTKAIAEKLNSAAKKLYDSGANKEFNKLVDQAKQDLALRTKDAQSGVNTGKYIYLEALQVAAPESGLNSIGSGAYGQTNAQYNAAKLAESTGIQDNKVSGWSEAMTKARLEAGTYGGYAEQLARGAETLRGFSGDKTAYADIIKEARVAFAQMDSVLKTPRPDSMDNFENSILAMMADVYDPKSRTILKTASQIEKAAYDAKWRADNIASMALLGKPARTEGMSVSDVSAKGVGPSVESITQDYASYIEASNAVLAAEESVRQAKYTGEKVTLYPKTAYDNYNTVVNELYAKYGAGQNKQKFAEKLEGYAGQYDAAMKSYNDYSMEKATKNFLPDSAMKGKTSAFTPRQLMATTVSDAYMGVGEDISFDIDTKNGMRNVTIEQDYGTAQELSETAVGIRFRNASGTIAETENLKGAGKDRFFEAAAKALDDNNSNLAIIKQTVGEERPSSVENPKYDWAKGGKQYDADGKEITPYIDQGKTAQRFSDDVLQDFGDGWVLVARNADPYARTVERSFRGTGKEMTPMEVADAAMADYADKTQNYSPEKAMKKANTEYAKAQKKADSINNKINKIKNSVDKKSITMDSVAKKVLDEAEYKQFRAAADRYNEAKAAKPTADTDIYRPFDGRYTIIKAGKSIPAGHMTVADFLAILGFNPKDFNSDVSEGRVYTEAELAADKKAHKAMQKQINKNMRAGNVRSKNVKQFETPTALDLKSQVMTINNLLAFAKQVKASMGLGDDVQIKAGDIVLSKDTADMIYRYSREGINTKGAKGWIKTVGFELTDWNKFIQNLQLAGGASWVNALSIAQLRGQILSNPLKMAQYIKLCTDFKDDASVRAFLVANQNRLSDIAIKMNDHTILTEMMAACSEKPGADGGVISAQAESLYNGWKNRNATSRTNAEKYEYAKDFVQNSTEALFGDATFKRMLPVLRAKSLIMNYDQALRLINKKFPNIDADVANDAAIKFSYAKTTAFFDPGAVKGRTIDEALKGITDKRLRDTVATWTGAKDEISIGQMASNCFFAMGYKYRMVEPVFTGAKSAFSPLQILERFNLRGTFDATGDMSLSGNDIMNSLGTQFMRSGDRAMVYSLMGIAAIAFINAKALGLATSWDDLSFTYNDKDGNPILDKDGNPMYKIPEILKKFQTIGQIWIPNTIGENGIPYVDPTKRAFKLDTMSSMFTLPNTFWKTIDRTINPQAYYSAPQRGVGLFGQEMGINPQGLNNILNSPLLRAIGDEAIGSNLLSPYKAMYEILVDSSYYGNNIWEKKYLSDGSINPNYDPVRNIQASFMHLLGLDELLDPNGYNRWVKGYYTDDYKDQDQVGTITGSGILQHEYFTMVSKVLGGEAIEGIIEGGELPIKSQKLSSTARTEFNTSVKNIIAQFMADYRNKVDGSNDAELKDKAYAETVQKCADVVAAWSAKYDYVLGKDQSLVPYATRCMMAILAGEYDDRLAYIQNTYWKASDIAQIEASGPADYWLDDSEVEDWIKQGKTAEDFANEKNRRTDAYHQALDDEYRARKALHEAGIDNEYLAGMSDKNLDSERRQINKEVYYGAMKTLQSKIGEFDNFKEMKEYYEAQIEATTSTKQKVKLAEQYNKYVTDALAPYVAKYGASIISDGYYNHDYLSNALAEYIIIPADKHYTGKTPRASYLKDLFGVGYRNKSNLPSDDEVVEAYTQAVKQMHAGYSASSVAILDKIIDAVKRGRLYASDADYSKIIKMKALQSARSK